jgi:uncharacterized protein (DUF433 family)
MNAKLVESLVQVIQSLSAEDYSFFQQRLVVQSIQKTEGVCGGHARIRNTRIPVWTVISLHNQGADDTELLADFPALTLFDLAAARAYYNAYPLEIDALIASHDSEDEYVG